MAGIPPISRSSPPSVGVDPQTFLPAPLAPQAGPAASPALSGKRDVPGDFAGSSRLPKRGVPPLSPSAAAGVVTGGTAGSSGTATDAGMSRSTDPTLPEWATDPVRRRPAGRLANDRFASEVAREVDFAESLLDTPSDYRDRTAVLKLGVELRHRGLTLDAASQQVEAFEAFMTLGKTKLKLDQSTRAAARRYGLHDGPNRTAPSAVRVATSSLPSWARARAECRPPVTVSKSDLQKLQQADRNALSAIDSKKLTKRSVVGRFLVMLNRHGGSLEMARADPLSASHLLDSVCREGWLTPATLPDVNWHLGLKLMRIEADGTGESPVEPAGPVSPAAASAEELVAQATLEPFEDFGLLPEADDESWLTRALRE